MPVLTLKGLFAFSLLYKPLLCLYITAVANTQSAKKAIRSSERKRQHNLFWKRRVGSASKNLQKLLKEGANADILNENLSVLQKVVDKAVKEKVIHKNKANRLKSKFAEKIRAAHDKSKKPEKKNKGDSKKDPETKKEKGKSSKKNSDSNK